MNIKARILVTILVGYNTLYGRYRSDWAGPYFDCRRKLICKHSSDLCVGCKVRDFYGNCITNHVISALLSLKQNLDSA